MFLDVCLTGRPHTRYRSHTRGRGGHRVRGPPCAGFAGRRLVPLTCPVTCAGGEQAEQAPSATVASAPMSGLPWAVVPRSYV